MPDLGWVGFDPSNRICPDLRHVRVATGLDYSEAAPVSGTRFGSGTERLTVTVAVEQVQLKTTAMTYGVGLKLERGLVFMSDTRTNAGVDNISTFRKLFTWCDAGDTFVSILTGRQPGHHSGRDFNHRRKMKAPPTEPFDPGPAVDVSDRAACGPSAGGCDRRTHPGARPARGFHLQRDL